MVVVPGKHNTKEESIMDIKVTAGSHPVNGTVRRLIEELIEAIETLPLAVLPVWTAYSRALADWDLLVERYPSPLVLLTMDDAQVIAVRDEMVEAASKLNAASIRLVDELKLIAQAEV